MGQHDESLMDKVKNAFGMGRDERDSAADDSPATSGMNDPETVDAEVMDGGRDDGWAGVPEALYDDAPGGASAASGMGDTASAGLADEPSGLGRNPGPVGSAQYEDGVTPAELGGADLDPEGNIDPTREEVASSSFGGAYGRDDTPMPTEAAWDRGEADPMPGDAGTDEDDALGRRDPGPL